MNKYKVILLAVACIATILPLSLVAQTKVLGVVTDEEGTPLRSVSVQIASLQKGTYSNSDGRFLLTNIPIGTHVLTLRHIGFTGITDTISVTNKDVELHYTLPSDKLNLSEVVVSATRNETLRQSAPVIVSTVESKIFEATQSVSLAEGLAFSPGLRVENNCSNCGFTQVRMNGLAGPYSQILINSRPVFSALMGVYGLEMLPTSMIERIEVVRGGGSALFGGNAIAGTINIITKDPTENSFSASLLQGFTDLKQPDRTISINGSVVDEDGVAGISFYGFDRNRSEWDANNDGFSDITLLRNTTLGMNAFYHPIDNQKLQFSLYNIREFRRGGNNFHLQPHQTDITEQLTHSVLGGSLSWEIMLDNNHKFSAYFSAQQAMRDSYYGGGGRVLLPGDSLTESDILALNAYGASDDISLVGGVQYAHQFSPAMVMTVGSEYQYNSVTDSMPGYNRSIKQDVTTIGNYLQAEIKPSDELSLIVGSRFDIISIKGNYNFAVEQFQQTRNLAVFVPRISMLYSANNKWQFRAGFAQGYRAPQAFDEDLHIETVGGAARFTQLSEDLQTERSQSFTASATYTTSGKGFQTRLLAEGFYTMLENPFILSDAQELPSGVSIITKRNGNGAAVFGVNLEAALALGNWFEIQSGFTLQRAQFSEAETLWSPEPLNDTNSDSLISTNILLRTPDYYGYATANFTPFPQWNTSLSAVFTGSMAVPHVINPENEYTIIKQTPSFLEISLKTAYSFSLHSGLSVEVSTGVNNIFNSFQEDLDIGATRDAGYIYGPIRPRTLFLGMKVGL